MAIDEPLRADARRNRERILAAAEEVFGEGGTAAGVAEVARRAGVGQGTVFRRFPTKDDLLVALMEQRMLDLAARARHEAGVAPAHEGLERFMTHMAERYAADRGFLEASGHACAMAPELSEIRAEVRAAVAALLERAQAAGRVRGDLRAEDVLFLAGAVNHVFNEEHTTPGLWRRYLGLVVDGMRAPGATPLSPDAPSLEEIEERIARRGAA